MSGGDRGEKGKEGAAEEGHELHPGHLPGRRHEAGPDGGEGREEGGGGGARDRRPAAAGGGEGETLVASLPLEVSLLSTLVLYRQESQRHVRGRLSICKL